MKECEMGETCNTHGRKDKLVQTFGGKALKRVKEFLTRPGYSRENNNKI
jgi:hypothetical protein